jgi:hypothetical protein
MDRARVTFLAGFGGDAPFDRDVLRVSSVRPLNKTTRGDVETDKDAWRVMRFGDRIALIFG